MTPEEIQKTIEGMLSIQAELQKSQVSFRGDLEILKEESVILRESIAALAESTSIHIKTVERQINRLIGYSLSEETARLDIEERLRILESKMRRISTDDRD